MFKDAGNGLKVWCDYETKTLRIQQNSQSPMFLPLNDEVVVFTSSKDYYTSIFVRLVTERCVSDSISWFWHDIENPPGE